MVRIFAKIVLQIGSHLFFTNLRMRPKIGHMCAPVKTFFIFIYLNIDLLLPLDISHVAYIGKEVHSRAVLCQKLGTCSVLSIHGIFWTVSTLGEQLLP